MHPLNFTAQTSSNGVVERDFTVGEIPGVLWSPANSGRVPLVLLGHGGGRHKKAAPMVGRAHRLVRLRNGEDEAGGQLLEWPAGVAESR